MYASTETMPAPPPEVTVTVECFALRLADGGLVARRVAGALCDSPDRTAAALVNLAGHPLDGLAVLHSTSWRWENGLILTYLCCPDPLNDAASEIVRPAHSHHNDTENPSRPGERWFPAGDVLHHGIDHFAWLCEHRPDSVATSRRQFPALWDVIQRQGQHRAGQINR